MNIEALHDYIGTFRHEIIDSGFKRDLDDYSSSLPGSKTNVLALRDIAEKVLSVLDHLFSSDLPDSLRALLPSEIRPFTEEAHNVKLKDLIDNTEIQLEDFFTDLTKSLNQLNSELQHNISEIDRIEKFIAPYLSSDLTRRTRQNIAMISIVFKEQKTISNLPEFTKTLTAWNKGLPLYHQLLKSRPPEDVQIVEVQNGTIELIVDLDVDVAIDLTKLFKLGFQVFAAYLAYKKLTKPITDSFHGNKKLINMEKEKEELLLENIGTAIQQKIMKQHKKSKGADKKIDGTSADKKAKVVTQLVSSHIVKGNDFKLLALPETEEQEDGQEDVPDEREALREQSLAVRQQLRLLPDKEHQKLLKAYGQNDEESE